MKKIMKLCIVGIFIGLLIPLKVQALVSPTSDFYINDYANILSEETKNYILNKSVALEKETTAQIVVVTVPNLEDKSLEEYATELFRKFGIGDKEKNNGLLLLLALEERQFRVEVGYGLEGVLPDGLTGRYQDEYIIPYLKENNWDEGIKNGYNAFYKKVAESYNLDASDIAVTQIKSASQNQDFDFTSMIFLFLISGVLWGTTVFNKRLRIVSLIVIIFALIFNMIPIIICYFNSIPVLILGLILEIISLVSSRNSNGSSFFFISGGGSGGSGFSSGGGFSGGGGLSGGGGSSRGF